MGKSTVVLGKRSLSRAETALAPLPSLDYGVDVATRETDQQLPDSHGHFGTYGGMFVPETLMDPMQVLADEYEKTKADPEFQKELNYLLRQYCGRPTPLYYAERWTEKLGGAKIYLKREDLLHTGAHKINNAIGQILLAKRLGKKRIIAETGAGQHGVATATVCARFGMECIVYMGAIDMERQALNVARMELLGAKVVPVTAGQATLKEAVACFSYCLIFWWIWRVPYLRESTW